MKNLYISIFIIASLLASFKSAYAQTKISFNCNVSSKTPRTIAKTSQKEVVLITWESNAFASSGFTPERRCNEVSDRLQRYAKAGALRYITTGKINNQNVICVSRYRDGKCRPDGLILTLEKNEDPPTTLKSLFGTAFKVSGGVPLRRSEKVTLDLEKIFN